MSLVSLILPIGKQYKFTTTKNPTVCLNELRAHLKPSTKTSPASPCELEGRIAGENFVVHRYFKSKLRKLFSPELQGSISVDQSGTVIQVVTAPNPSAASLINSSLSTLLGAIIGLLAIIVLVPNMVPRVYAFLWTAVVPIVVSLASALVSRIFAENDAKVILTKMSQCFDSEQVADPRGIAVSVHNTVPQQIMTGCVACLVFIGISLFTNSMIERCWVNGRYDKVESFCRPATQIVEMFLGPDNIVAAECRYQLAEALRAETPGRFREAESIYEKNLHGADSYFKSNKTALANNLFSLGRVLDQSGRHADAEKSYRQAIENWEQSTEVGPRSTILAKALDRLAMVCLKEHNYKDAEAFEKRALEIDTAHGAGAERSVGEDLNDLALVYDQQDNYSQAKEFYKQAVEYKVKHLDPVDYSRATSLYNLAEIEKMTGDMKGYAKHSTEAYAIWKKLLRFKASYTPLTTLASTNQSAGAAGLEFSYAENGIDNGIAVPDPMSCYIRILRATKPDYESPHIDARFDGLRPYLGRE